MNYNRPRLRSRLTAVFTLVLTAGLLALPATASASNHKITICAATASQTNPYTTAHPTKHQVAGTKGHGGNDAVHPNDIVPPFEAGSQGNNSWDAYPGQNWDAAGQKIWNDGCKVVDNGFDPTPDFDLTGNTGEVCLGVEVTITGENTGNVMLQVTGTWALPDETEMPLDSTTLAPGEKLTEKYTPVQLGVHEISLDYAYDDKHVGNEKISFTIVDCDPVVTQCPSGFTQISAPGANPVLCTQTVTQIQVQERIVERIVEVPVPELPTELPTGPTGPDEPADEADETSGPILPTELATGFGPTDTSNTIAWYALALMGLAVTGAGVALRRN
jgi:hypothetical protein